MISVFLCLLIFALCLNMWSAMLRREKGFQISFLFGLLSFSPAVLFIEFYFHILGCLPYVIQLFIFILLEYILVLFELFRLLDNFILWNIYKWLSLEAITMELVILEETCFHVFFLWYLYLCIVLLNNKSLSFLVFVFLLFSMELFITFRIGLSHNMVERSFVGRAGIQGYRQYPKSFPESQLLPTI